MMTVFLLYGQANNIWIFVSILFSDHFCAYFPMDNFGFKFVRYNLKMCIVTTFVIVNIQKIFDTKFVRIFIISLKLQGAEFFRRCFPASLFIIHLDAKFHILLQWHITSYHRNKSWIQILYSNLGFVLHSTNNYINRTYIYFFKIQYHTKCQYPTFSSATARVSQS
jgi:hypothetical protein